MMGRWIVTLTLLALAGAALPGCIAIAIPALAGSAMLGSRAASTNAEGTVSPTAAATPDSAPVAAPVTVPAPDTPATPSEIAAVTEAVPAEPAPAPAEPLPVPVATVAAAPAIIAPPPAAPIAESTPPAPLEPSGFAQFVRYGSAIAAAGARDTAPLSAMLSDPIAINGQRRRCESGEQPVAVIDLDPKGSVFAPPSDPVKQPGRALGLAVLREAGVVITWLSDLSVNQSGALRTALEKSGLDPRGEDIISLRRETDDRKQQRKDNLAGITCIIAIAGDERADFDERFIYLRSPEAGAELEPVIGDGWFLIEPVFPEQGKASQ